MVGALERAMRCTSTSESADDVKMEPCATSSRFSSWALVRLPLCESASGPQRVFANIGCAFARTVLPEVE